MANTDVVNLIISTTADFFMYMLPIIAVMSGIIFLVTWLMSITIGLGRKTFR